MDLGLKDKTALVLGGGGGLGRAIVKTLAAEGANLAVADIDPAAIAGTKTALEAIPGKSICLVLDSRVWSPMESCVTSPAGAS